MEGECPFVSCYELGAGLCCRSFLAGPSDANVFVFLFLNCRFSIEMLICQCRKHSLGKEVFKTGCFANGRFHLVVSTATVLKQGVILSPGGHLTMSGDVFWLLQVGVVLLAGRGQRCC